MQQAKQAEQLEALQKAIEAKEATWKRLEGGQGKFADIKARFDSELANLQAQKDELQRERGSLIRVRPTVGTALALCVAPGQGERLTCRLTSFIVIWMPYPIAVVIVRPPTGRWQAYGAWQVPQKLI